MEAAMSTSMPIINGLVLAGGESSRMGFDKGLIDYHGLPQREYLLQLLQPYTSQTFLSCRPGQVTDLALPFIEDVYENLGPFGAVLSAFQFDAQAAWLVVACDFPLLNRSAIEQLVSERVSNSIATSFLDPHTLMPEPWITILEPKIYPILQDYNKKGRSSLRGVLVDYNSAVIRAANPDTLLNANTPEEVERLRLLLQSKH